jgi:hypothetical protein
MITLKDAVTNSTAKFSHAIAGVLYYNLFVNDDVYQFSIDMNDKDDVGTTTFVNEYRGITLMRYIRKAIENESFVKLNS